MDYIFNNRLNLAFDVMLSEITEGCPQIISEDVVSSIDVNNMNLIFSFLKDNGIDTSCFIEEDHASTEDYFKEAGNVHKKGLGFGDLSPLHRYVKFDFITRLMNRVSNIERLILGILACDVGSRIIWSLCSDGAKEYHLLLSDIRFDLSDEFSKHNAIHFALESGRVENAFNSVREYVKSNFISLLAKSQKSLKGSARPIGYIDGSYSRYLVGGRVLKIKTYMFDTLFYWKATDTWYLLNKNGIIVMSVNYNGSELKINSYEKSFSNENYHKIDIEAGFSSIDVKTFKRKIIHMESEGL